MFFSHKFCNFKLPYSFNLLLFSVSPPIFFLTSRLLRMCMKLSKLHAERGLFALISLPSLYFCFLLVKHFPLARLLRSVMRLGLKKFFFFPPEAHFRITQNRKSHSQSYHPNVGQQVNPYFRIPQGRLGNLSKISKKYFQERVKT